MKIQPKLKLLINQKIPPTPNDYFSSAFVSSSVCWVQQSPARPADRQIEQTPCNPWNAERRHGWWRVYVCVYVWAGEMMRHCRHCCHHHPPPSCALPTTHTAFIHSLEEGTNNNTSVSLFNTLLGTHKQLKKIPQWTGIETEFNITAL